MRLSNFLSVITAIIVILIPFSLSYGTDPAQQNNKPLISLIHSGTDPVGFMLYTLLKHQISMLDNFQLASEKEIPLIRLELITFTPMKPTLNTRIYHVDMLQFGLLPKAII